MIRMTPEELIARQHRRIADLEARAAADAEVIAAARDVWSDARALLTHYRRHTKHRCAFDRDIQASLLSLDALLAARDGRGPGGDVRTVTPPS